MRISFITNVPTSIARVRLREESEKRGHSFTLMSWRNTLIQPDFAEKIADTLSDYDVVHFAGGLGKFATKAIQTVLEGRGAYCPNSYARRSFDSDHKVYQAVRFVETGIPVPKSIRATHPDFALIEKEIGWPMIAKEPDSSQGKGVRMLRSQEDAALLVPKKEYLFQQYIDYEGDYRVHVIGGKAFCPYRRIPPSGDFRANVSLGGSMERVSNEQTRKEICDLAVRAAEAMGLEYCAVDMVRDRQGRIFVLETNSDPGFKDVEEITGESFASVILDHYEDCVR